MQVHAVSNGQLSDRATTKENLLKFEEARDKVQKTIDRHGWVVQWLLAAAENQLVWERFRQVGIVAAVATAATIVGLAGFSPACERGRRTTRSTGHCRSPSRSPAPAPSGPACPGSFEALLTSGGKTAPWEIMIVDPDCAHGTLIVTSEEGRVLFVP